MIRRPPHTPIASTARENLSRLLDALPYADDDRHPTRVVRAACLRRAKFLTDPFFETLFVPDLELLFDLYDEHAFRGLLSRALPAGSPGRPNLRVSSRMTRTAGKTLHRHVRISPFSDRCASSLEIAISAPLLAAEIDTENGTRVVGVLCHDRLAVLQRVFEHELIHALLFCLDSDVRCSRESFRSIAFGLFGHLESTHTLQLAPPAWKRPEARAAAPNVRPGDRVRFDFRGTVREGLVNRITRRATVLVEDPAGRRYSDGVRYLKYYIPLGMLTVIDA